MKHVRLLFQRVLGFTHSPGSRSKPHFLRATRGVLGVSWPFLLIIAFLVGLASFTMNTLSAARAFAGGESLWSKGQKEAVENLDRYVISHNGAYYNAYLQMMAIPLGDHRARQALNETPVDYKGAVTGFEAGGFNPKDIPGVIRLYRRFHNFGPMARAVEVWSHGDVYLADLSRIGAAIHADVRRGDDSGANRLLTQAYHVDAELTPLEIHFTNLIGQASRLTKEVFLFLTLITAILFTTAGLAFVKRLVDREYRATDELKRRDARQQFGLAASDQGAWNVDFDHQEIFVSPHFMRALGHAGWPGSVPIREFMCYVNLDDRAMIEARIMHDDRVDTGRSVEFRLLAGDQTPRWIRSFGAAARDTSGRRVAIGGVFRDITEQRLIEAAATEQRERSHVTLQAIDDGVLTTRHDGQIDYVNPAAERLLGLGRSEILGTYLHETLTLLDRTTNQVLADPRAGATVEGVDPMLTPRTMILRRDEQKIPVQCSCAAIKSADGVEYGCVFVLRDVSAQMEVAEKLSFHATRDALTGIFNRTQFERAIERVMATGSQTPKTSAVLFIDLDQFKIINDTCGHCAGDELLRQIACLLGRSIRTTDLLARLGGDEFGILLADCGRDDALRVADKLREAVCTFPFTWSGRSFTVGISIGLVMLDGHFHNLSGVMVAADDACYLAKEKGRNRVQMYQASDEEILTRRGMTQWVGRIRDALNESRFVLYAQPIVSVGLQKRDEMRFEVLLRMTERDGRIVPPNAFLPAAERFGLIYEIDNWVVERTFQVLSGMVCERLCSCSINLSAVTICDDRFVDFVIREQSRFSIPPEKICFEITETSMISNFSKASRVIGRLRTHGFSFALDDFGAGASSFAYLKALPVDYVKIDGAYVRDLPTNEVNCAMVDAINRIGHIMGIKTVAEFVESDAILGWLKSMGVDFAQGYGIAKPVPLEPLLEECRRSCSSTPSRETQRFASVVS